MLMYRVQYAADPVKLAEACTELNRQARERKATQWRVVSVFEHRGEQGERVEDFSWCAFLETEREEPR